MTSAFESFLLQLSLLVFVLGGLSVLRGDAIVLVLGPLRRMLKIVARCKFIRYLHRIHEIITSSHFPF